MGLKSFDSGAWRWDVLSQHQHLQKSNTSASSCARVWKAGAHNAEKLQEEVAQLNEEAPCPWDPQTCYFWLTSVGCNNNSTMQNLQTCALLVRVLCLVMLARKRRTRWYLGVVGPLVASSRSCCSAAHWRTRTSIARGVVNILSMQLQLDSFCCLCTPQDCRHCWKTFYCAMLSSRMGCSRFAHAVLTLAHASLTLRSRFAHACSCFAHALLTLAHTLLTLCGRCLFTVASRRKPPAPSVMDSGSLRSWSCFRLVFPALGYVGLIFHFYTIWSRLPSITLTYRLEDIWPYWTFFSTYWALFSSVWGYLGPMRVCWPHLRLCWPHVSPS